MMRRMLTVATLALALLPATGCLMSPRTAAGLGEAVLLTALVASDVMVLAAHDAHYHSYGCGHYHRYREGRWEYYYGNHWEYYDGGRWYYYSR